MNEQVKMSDVLMCAFELVISRYGDVDTEDGSFATCGTDEIIRLDEAMAHFFGVGSDDLEAQYADLIFKKSKQLDKHIELIAKQAEQIKILREVALSASVALSECAIELNCFIDMKNADLELSITSCTENQPDYFDAQTVHESMVAIKDLQQALSATEQE